MSDSDTKTRILDSAEYLFAQEGFHNTSLRALTTHAEVNLASVNYHFGSKEALLQAVLERRLLPLNQLRTDQMNAVVAKANAQNLRPEAANILRAFIEPTLAFRDSSPGARSFIALVGRSLSEPDATVRSCFIELALPVFQVLFQNLHQALPQLPPAVLLARLQFIMGALSHVMCMDDSQPLAVAGLPEPLSAHELVEDLLRFVSTGLEAS